MKKLVCPFALSLSLMVGFGDNVSAQNAKTRAKLNQPLSPPLLSRSQESSGTTEELAAESVRLYYNRSAETIVELLNNVLGNNKDKTSIAASGITTNEEPKTQVSLGTNQNIIILYGRKAERDKLKRIIAVLDLPRERVNMEMWGILISSNDPEELAKVMREVNREIEKTQKSLRGTYSKLETLAKGIDIDPDYKYLFETVLGYSGAFDKDSLSMTDILLRINAAKDPVDNINSTAKNICELFAKDPKYKPYVDALDEGKTPFGNYLEVGLLPLVST